MGLEFTLLRFPFEDLAPLFGPLNKHSDSILVHCVQIVTRMCIFTFAYLRSSCRFLMIQEIFWR